LDSVRSQEGALWFTLVIENPSNHHVEIYKDSNQPFVKDRLKILKPNEFGSCQVNGVFLGKLVENKMKEILEAAKFRGQQMLGVQKNGSTNAANTANRTA